MMSCTETLLHGHFKYTIYGVCATLCIGGLISLSRLWRSSNIRSSLLLPSKAATIARPNADAEFLNQQNLQPGIPSSSDVVVVGAGIHSLIYAIHLRLRSQSLSARDPKLRVPGITVLERLSSPGYKIGESTLTTFGVWLKSAGISTAVLWRLFGAKDGLAFYFLPQDGSWDGGTSFCANGPSGDFVATLQMERKISELLLTVFAQRLGVNVLHGTGVDVPCTPISADAVLSRLAKVRGGSGKGRIGHVKLTNGLDIKTKLLVDATGRFRRIASKQSNSERFLGFNTEAFWAYFDMVGDEADLPFDNYESCHTNHICLAEGYVLILPFQKMIAGRTLHRVLVLICAL